MLEAQILCVHTHTGTHVKREQFYDSFIREKSVKYTLQIKRVAFVV